MFQSEKKTSLRLSLAFALAGLGDIDEATDGPLRYLSSNLTSRSWKGVATPFLAELARKQLRQKIPQLKRALTGKVTSFVGPLLIGLVTAATASQKAGMSVLVAFFLAGLVLLRRVREG